MCSRSWQWEDGALLWFIVCKLDVKEICLWCFVIVLTGWHISPCYFLGRCEFSAWSYLIGHFNLFLIRARVIWDCPARCWNHTQYHFTPGVTGVSSLNGPRALLKSSPFVRCSARNSVSVYPICVWLILMNFYVFHLAGELQICRNAIKSLLTFCGFCKGYAKCCLEWLFS